MAKPLIILQARTSSRRLPAKALVNFRGYPLAILAALRAATRGDRVILATSASRSDDMLAAVAAKHGIECFRGPLDDVLGRFCQALGDVPDDTPVVRLTGDNIVPDGDLINEVVEDMVNSGAQYMTSGDKSGLPYGVSVEATYARHLRAADRNSTTKLEREHVTTWVRASQGVTVFGRYASLELDKFRLTVDSIDDLASISQVFPETDEPIALPWRELVSRSHLGLYQPGPNTVGPEMVLGTAQLGMAYGINRASSPSFDEGQEIVRTAIANGVQWLDTARVYGESEAVLGQVLGAGWDGRCRVVTKLDALTAWGHNEAEACIRAAAEVSLLTSLQKLKLSKLDIVLLHRAEHWRGWNGALADLMLEWREADRISAIGVSVQSPEELEIMLAEPAIEHIQLPFNILDHRWDGLYDSIFEVKAKRSLTVHLRSALLQGLLVSDDPALWQRAHVPNAREIRAWLNKQVRELNQLDIVALCINWCRAQKWADGVVIGVDDIEQLNQNLSIFSRPCLDLADLDKVTRCRPQLSARTLNPARWQVER